MTVIDAAPRAAHTSSATETPEPGQYESVDVTFAELGLPSSIVQRLEKQRIERPFPIQAAVIPDALAGRDVAGRAPTGQPARAQH